MAKLITPKEALEGPLRDAFYDEQGKVLREEALCYSNGAKQAFVATLDNGLLTIRPMPTWAGSTGPMRSVPYDICAAVKHTEYVADRDAGGNSGS